MAIPTVDNVDFDLPEQHVLPALVHLPAAGGAPTITHPSTLEEWSKRIRRAGYVYVPWLIEKYANEDGMIRVSDLPLPEIRFDPPTKGPVSTINPGGKWVSVDEPLPQRPVIPDLTKMTNQEIGGILAQAQALGFVTEKAELVDIAEVVLD